MQTQSGNLIIHYSEQGRNLPLLMIHGYPLNRRLWQPQLSGLSDIARVITIDLRGHGESPSAPGLGPVPNAYSMDLLANDCVRLLDALKISQPVVVCGLSMGGYIAFALYKNYPKRVAGLILAATRASADTPEAKSNRNKAVEFARQGGAPEIAQSMIERMLAPENFAHRPDLVETAVDIMRATTVEAIIGDLLGMRDRPDSTPLLPNINVPTLIIHGRDDQLIPLSEAQTMQASIPDADLQIIPVAGHLVNLEQPELFNQAVSDFWPRFV